MTDVQTDEWTHDDCTYRVSIASRGKKRVYVTHVFDPGLRQSLVGTGVKVGRH